MILNPCLFFIYSAIHIDSPSRAFSRSGVLRDMKLSQSDRNIS